MSRRRRRNFEWLGARSQTLPQVWARAQSQSQKEEAAKPRVRRRRLQLLDVEEDFAETQESRTESEVPAAGTQESERFSSLAPDPRWLGPPKILSWSGHVHPSSLGPQPSALRELELRRAFASMWRNRLKDLEQLPFTYPPVSSAERRQRAGQSSRDYVSCVRLNTSGSLAAAGSTASAISILDLDRILTSWSHSPRGFIHDEADPRDREDRSVLQSVDLFPPGGPFVGAVVDDEGYAWDCGFLPPPHLAIDLGHSWAVSDLQWSSVDKHLLSVCSTMRDTVQVYDLGATRVSQPRITLLKRSALRRPRQSQVSNMGGFTDLHVEANVLWGVSGHSELLLWDIRASATPVRAVNLDSSFAHHLKAARVSRILGLQSSSTPISRSSLSRNSAGILSTPDSQLLFIPRASGHCQAFDRRMLSKLRPLSMFSVFPVPRDPSSHQRTSPGQLSSSNSISSSSSSSPERTSAESAGVIQAHTSPGRGSRRPRFGEGPTSLSCAILDSQNPDFLLYQLLDSTVGCYDISTGEAVPLYTPLITQFYDSFSFRRTRACGITSVARPHLNPTLCYGGRSNTLHISEILPEAFAPHHRVLRRGRRLSFQGTRNSEVINSHQSQNAASDSELSDLGDDLHSRRDDDEEQHSQDDSHEDVGRDFEQLFPVEDDFSREQQEQECGGAVLPKHLGGTDLGTRCMSVCAHPRLPVFVVGCSNNSVEILRC